MSSPFQEPHLAGNFEVQANQTLDLAARTPFSVGGTNAVAGAVGAVTSTTGTQVFTGDFTLGSLTASSDSCSFAGASVVFSSFSHNGGTLVLNGTANQSFTSGGQGLANFTVANAAGVTLADDVRQTANYALNITAGSRPERPGWVADPPLTAPTADTSSVTPHTHLNAGTELRCFPRDLGRI
jgi:hypothetical protein